MATFNIASPDQVVPATMNVRTREYQFGDGYTQSVQDDVNALNQSYDLTFTNRNQSTIMAIDDFFRAAAGAPFTWVNPRGESLRFTCKSWVPNYQVSTSCSLTCTINQTFQP